MIALLEGPASGRGWAEALVWLGNGCYFSRFLIQWVASERAGRPVAPRVFWWLSVAGSILVGAYTWVIGEPVLLLSYVLVFAIYVRNLFLGRGREGREPPSMAFVMLLALAAWGVALFFGMRGLQLPEGEHWIWAGVAVLGTAIWSSRFVVQWLKSERRGESYFPRTFWWLSLAGNSLLLVYVIHLRNPGLIAGLAIGPIVQVRNLMIASNARRGG